MISLREAKSKIEHYENKLESTLKLKEINWQRTQPQSRSFDKELVKGGKKRKDKYFKYVVKNEEYDKDIDYYQEQIKVYEDFIEKELKIMNTFDEWEQLVIYLRIDKKMKWEEILPKVPFSLRSCQRIVKEYTGKRDI